jgi:hypothetical protein
MYSVSDRFLEAVRQSGHRKTVVDVYHGRSTEPLLSDLPVIDCQIKVDRNSNTRRSGSITIGDPTLFSLVEPWGLELVIKTGPEFPDREELVPMGVFVIDTDSFRITEGSFPKVEIFDRTQRVTDVTVNLLADDTQFAGESVRAIVSRAIDGAAPGYPNAAKWTTSFDPTLPFPQLPGGFDPGTDRWALAKKAAELLGADVYFDVNGDPQCRKAPTFDRSITQSQSVWDIRYGQNLIDLEKTVTRANVFNGVLVRGGQKNNDSPEKTRPFALAVDNDPRSRTYWNGPFGKKTRDVSNEGITDSAQAYALAVAELQKSLLLVNQFKITCLANPALDAGDIISLYETASQTTPTLCIVDGFSFNSTYANFEIDARALDA